MMNKEWVLDVQDESCPANVKKEIFSKMKEDWWLANDSVRVVDIGMLKSFFSKGCDEDNSDCGSIYRYPILIKFLEDQNLSDDEKVYVYISW